METTIIPGRIQTMICSLNELPTLNECDFCKTLYKLTEEAALPDDVYEAALQLVNDNAPYKIFDEGNPVNKIRSWLDSLRFLNSFLTDCVLDRIGDVLICFEYRLKNRWVDAVIACDDKLIVLEFKSGATTAESEILKYISQVNKYYNRISHRNRAVVEDIAAGKLTVEKYLIFTNDKLIGQVEREEYILTRNTFSTVIEAVTTPCPRDRIVSYLDTSSYFDPTITGAFASLLTKGIVNYVQANNQNVQACYDIISRVLGLTTRELGIILVKGGPGTGKTGTAFTLLQNCINNNITRIQYVTGNNNLEKYFTGMVEEAVGDNGMFAGLAGIAESMIGHINTLYDPKNYCNIYLHQYQNVSPIAIDEDVLLVDEAQRLWNSLNIAIRSRKKGSQWVNDYLRDEQDYIYSNDLSETYLLLFGIIQGIIAQQRNKCIVLFLGNGQEINNGEENGEDDVLRAIGAIRQLAINNGINLKVYAPEQRDIERLEQYQLVTELIPELMLISNQRNDEGDPQLKVVSAILDGAVKLESSQNLYRVFNNFRVIQEGIVNVIDDDESIGLLVDSYDTWEEGKNAVYSFSKGATRYQFSGIGLNLYNYFHELGCNDFRQFVSQFDSQGLELDNTVVSWGNTLLWRNNRWTINEDKINGKSRYGRIWVHCDKANKLIKRVPNPSGRQPAVCLNYNAVREQFVKNAYRVLLTRARQSTYIYVQDIETFNHLKKLLEETD